MTIRMMLLLAMLLAAPSAMAHSPLAASVPADGAVLAEAPDSLRLTFKGEASLARLSVLYEGTEMALGTAHLMQVRTQHRVILPELSPGRYEVRWRALSADGHVIKGDFSFSVED